MYTRDEIVAAFEQQEAESAKYWGAFDTGTFFRRIGEAWSPAENVRHLIKSTRPVVKALGVPGLVLWFKFGRAKRPSISYDELAARYQQKLDEGGKAGPFAPSEKSESDLEAWRRSIVEDYARVQRELRKRIARWPERKLDRLQLPHPLLGNLTVREMLFFTLLHQRHHVGVVQRRLAKA